MYGHPSGKAHEHMMGVYSDELTAGLAELADAVHTEGGCIAVQINHGGMQCSPKTVKEALAPSAIQASFLPQPARELTPAEIDLLVDSYAQAARRVKQAGFDGVQIHGAHGYLVSQFLSPFVNKRMDRWGGDPDRRMRFLSSICTAVREQVGPDYPLFIKLGVMDGVEGGLTLQDGVQVVAALESVGLDAVEISIGVGGEKGTSIRKGVNTSEDEGYFRPWGQAAQPKTPLPIILVGGFRSRSVMEDVLGSGDADFISLCRPLICEPDLPERMRLGLQERSRCISANRCWAAKPGEGISCKCPLEEPDD
jgi:2,4-dienoyl-CoA reductase-like NADH-dependent reductase (Old Yellow Enzyme family)